MKLRPPVLAAWILAGLAAGVMTAEDSSTPSVRETAPSPVLVELFTSQGCSSCPPADRLLSRITESLPKGATVVPLAFHVDYWNYIGWTDPFSSADWSERQRRYAGVLESRGVYTPQLVVNGRWDAVGSDEAEVEALIERARREQGEGRIGIAARPTSEDRIEVDLSADLSTGTSAKASDDLVVWLAVVESGFETPVGRGENVHKTLYNDHVVRRLLPALELDETAVGRRLLSIEADSGWKRANLSFAAFAQDRETLRIYAASTAELSD